MKWLRRTVTCSVCGVEFRRHRVELPSLVGHAYCTYLCERRAWDAWIKGVTP